MNVVKDCFRSVKYDCLKFIKKQETKNQKFKNKEKMIGSFIVPLSIWIANKKNKKNTLIIGLAGGQGTGKTTITSLISIILKKYFKMNVFIASIDDFYKSRKDRVKLSKKKHPLLLTRGVPGTHDIELVLNFFKNLKKRKFKSVKLPKFDKSIDDRAPKSKWYNVNTRPDVVILEGWCVAAEKQSTKDILKPINSLEKKEDKSHIWRRYVNTQLKTKYNTLNKYLDEKIYLKTPSFNMLKQWRIKQEEKLRLKFKKTKNSKVMTVPEVLRFMMFYQRVTLQMFKSMPKSSSVVLVLNKFHQITNIIFNKK